MTILYRRAVSGAVLLALVATGCASASGTRASGAATSLPTCTTGELSVSLVKSFAGLGETGGYIGFRNRARSSCRLTGWPRLVASRVGASTTAIRVRTTQYGPHLKTAGNPVVTLRHGGLAEAVFIAGDKPGTGKNTCPRPYRTLHVTPPGNAQSVALPAWIPYLHQYLPACTHVFVSMIVP